MDGRVLGVKSEEIKAAENQKWDSVKRAPGKRVWERYRTRRQAWA